MEEKKKSLVITFTLLFIIVVVIGAAYAYFVLTRTQQSTNVIGTLDCLDVSMSEESGAINLTGAIPVSDEDGIAKRPFTFKVVNNCDSYVKVNVLLDSTYRDSSDTNYLRDNLVKSNLSVSGTSLSNSALLTSYDLYEYSNDRSGYKLDTIIINPSPNGEKSYDLRLWVDGSTSVEQGFNKNWTGKVVLVAEAIEQSLANLVEIGDYINMTPTLTSAKAEKDYTGHSEDITFNPSELNLWRVISKNGNGTVDVVSEYLSSDGIIFKGATGYKNLVGYLNVLASKYTNEAYVQSTRHAGYSKDTTEFIENLITFEEIDAGDSYPAELVGGGDTGHLKDIALIKAATGSENGEPVINKVSGEYAPPPIYWLASRDYQFTEFNSDGDVDLIQFSGRTSGYGWNSMELYQRAPIGEIYEYASDYNIPYLRPILTLKSTVKLGTGDGRSSGTAYTLVA